MVENSMLSPVIVQRVPHRTKARTEKVSTDTEDILKIGTGARRLRFGTNRCIRMAPWLETVDPETWVRRCDLLPAAGFCSDACMVW
jgi:hypothetical protein